MGISYAVWGAFFGWMLMPRLRALSLQTLTTVVAYVVALAIAAIVAYGLDMQRQSWLFVVGMAAQCSLFVIAYVAKVYWGKRKEKIN